MFSVRRFGVGSLSLWLAACSATDRRASNDGFSSGGTEVSAGNAGDASDAAAPAGRGDPTNHEGGAAGAREVDETDPSGAGGEAGSTSDEGGTARSGASSGGASSGGAGGSGSGAGGSMSGAAGSISGAAGNPNDGLMIPCAVDTVLDVCRNCHTVPLAGGAPFPLLTLHDLQLAAGNAYGAVSTGEMPLGTSLSSEQTSLLLDWLGDGAPGVAQTECR